MSVPYYDPLWEISSKKMPFTIAVTVTMKKEADPALMKEAAQKAIVRYPYFSVRVEKQGEQLATVPNPAPFPVIGGDKVPTLGSKALSGHMSAIGVSGRVVRFYASHAMCDGAGFFPFIKTVLYEYLCLAEGKKLDPESIRLPDTPFFEDELGDPYPKDALKDAKPLYLPPKKPFFRLTEGKYAKDAKPVVYRLRTPVKDVMAFNHDHDGSPCVLLAALAAEAIASLHPENEKDLVCDVSFNLRPGLGNRNSYRMLCSSIPVRYPQKLLQRQIAMVCTCSRGMITLQSQKENVLFKARTQMEYFFSMRDQGTLAERSAAMGEMALRDSVNNTFSISYVGQMGLGSLEPYIDSIYNLTDGSTYRTLFLEVSAVGDEFDLAFIQGFSSRAYFDAFLSQMDRYALPYTLEDPIPLSTPKMVLPK